MNEPIAIVGETQAGRAAILRKQLMGLAGDIQSSTFDLAEKLSEAAEGQLYRAWGYDSLYEYGMLELNLKRRKIRYLVRIVEVMKIVGIKREVYEPIGVTKLREITTLDPAGNFFNTTTKQNEPLVDHIVRLVTEADDRTADEINEEVLRLKGQTGDNSLVTRSTTYVNSVWENVIKPAREQARRLMGSAGRDEEGNAVEYSDGAVEEMIHAEFLNDPNHQLEQDAPVVIQVPTEDVEI